MHRLSGLDASFLALETPANHMHVMGVAVVDPSDAPADFGFERFVRHIAERLPLIPPFRRRLVTVPFGIDAPVWIEDPAFDLDYHLRHVTAPAPGGPSELEAVAADIAGRPLDRSRPMWEMYFVEGLEGDRVAMISKIHHSVIDGVSGVDIMAHLFDTERDPDPRFELQVAPDWEPERVPSDIEMMAAGMLSVTRLPARAVRTVARTGRRAWRVAQRVRGAEVRAGVPLTAPKLTMNAPITPHRTIAFASLPLADVKRAKDTLGVKVNDIVLEITTSAMRSYLDGRGELPDRSLVATIPTSVRTSDQANTMGNRVSAMFARLPVELDDPIERIEAIRGSTADAKDLHEEVGGTTLQELAEVATPAMLSSAMRLVSTFKLIERFGGAVHNVVVSNVPGPPFPLYLTGARLEAMHPLGPIFDGAGLNLTVMSYLDRIDFGFLGCRELIPDLDVLAAAVPDALGELLKLVDSERSPAAPQRPKLDEPRPASAGLNRVGPATPAQ
jgi:WS/DGAT/MGAT family acyltransferase